MPERAVAVVFDLAFGQQIIEVAKQGSVWIVRSPANAAATDAARAAGLNATTFEPVNPSDPLASLLAILPDVDLHHGPDSQSLPYRAINVIGVEVSSGLREALWRLGFGNIRTTETGFEADVLPAVRGITQYTRWLPSESDKRFLPRGKLWNNMLLFDVQSATDIIGECEKDGISIYGIEGFTLGREDSREIVYTDTADILDTSNARTEAYERSREFVTDPRRKGMYFEFVFGD